MKIKNDTLLKELKSFRKTYIFTILSSVLFLVCIVLLQKIFSFNKLDQISQYYFETFLYIIIFFGIPFGFYYQKRQTKNIEQIENISERIILYKKSFRFNLVCSAVLFDLTGFFYLFSPQKKFMIICGIIFIYLLLNLPSYSKLATDLKLDKEDEEPEE